MSSCFVCQGALGASFRSPLKVFFFFYINITISTTYYEGSPHCLVSLHQFTGQGSCRVEFECEVLEHNGRRSSILDPFVRHCLQKSHITFLSVRSYSPTRGMYNTSKACFDIRACQDRKEHRVLLRLTWDVQRALTQQGKKADLSQTLASWSHPLILCIYMNGKCMLSQCLSETYVLCLPPLSF